MPSPKQAATRLWAQVPDPPPPRAKPAQSWRLLKVGQQLTNLTPILVGGTQVPAGQPWQVTHVDSLGAKLAHGSIVLFWNNPDWKAQFKRSRKTKSKGQE